MKKTSKTTNLSKKNKKNTKSTKPKKNLIYEIHVLNGPNMNMLGFREPEIYGSETLLDLEDKMVAAAQDNKRPGASIKLKFFQTNHEGEMIDYLHALVLGLTEHERLAGVIFNPSSWAHTSVALRDAVLMLNPLPVVEVHISNLTEREEYRQHSFLEDICPYRVVGMGLDGYVEALRWLLAEHHRDRTDVH